MGRLGLHRSKALGLPCGKMPGRPNAGVAQSYLDYLNQFDEHAIRWPEFLVPSVMDRQDLAPHDWQLLPHF